MDQTYKKKIRLYYKDNLELNSLISLSFKDTHYLKDVMRCKIHHIINIFNERDGEFECKIINYEKKSFIIQLLKAYERIEDKYDLVNSVFSKVHEKYDLMNDIMSLGVHRIWKNKFLDWLNPQPNTKLIDVASGTGDIANLFNKKTENTSKITCIEPNLEMFNQGKEKLKKFENINWINARAEKIPVNDNTYDYYTISYGLRNVSNINKSLQEAYRVLKPGGRLMCLEFSKIDNEILNSAYKQYSKTIPLIGKIIVGSDKPYKYLIESIEKFLDQKQLVDIMVKEGFSNVEFRNLTNGISAIHSGWKI